MVGRIILTVVVLALCFIAVQTIEQKVAPSHATGLVIDGVANVDTMEGNQAQARIEQNAQNWLYPLVGLIGVGCLV